jgi:CheY-like chemotaxis protein
VIASESFHADVLVVDDSADLAEMIVEYLSSLGYQAVSAPDGAEALRLLLGGATAKLILLDGNTPVLDGAGFLHAATGNLDGVAVVWMSGRAETTSHPAIVASLLKPFDLEALQRLVERHVGARFSGRA